MVMGGLIGETTGNSSKGLPLLSRIPIIGGLFGDQSLTKNRTELVMFITPRVVENENDLKNTIEDLRRRMQQIDDTFDVFRRRPRRRMPIPMRRRRRPTAPAPCTPPRLHPRQALTPRLPTTKRRHSPTLLDRKHGKSVAKSRHFDVARLQQAV